MEKKVLVVCVTVGFLGLLTAALGFAAEAKKIKASEVHSSATTSICTYPRSPALALGLIASVFLMIAQAIINISAGCICCKRNPHPSTCGWTTALACFIFSWFTFVIAFLLLLTGSALNEQHGQGSMYFNSYCYVKPGKSGVFAGGAILSLVSLTLGIIYYVSLSSVKNSGQWGVTAAYPHQGNIAMGHPQFPPQTQTAAQPVFVPEDTYTRRQYP